MLKGTRILMGQEAKRFSMCIRDLQNCALINGFQEVILPSIWESETFQKKISGETRNQMWTFKDQGDRDVCLIPEVTGIIQEMYDLEWSKSIPKPIRLFYVARCYRYERPQEGRYREFTQFGVEILGDMDKRGFEYTLEVKRLLKGCLDFLDVNYNFNDTVKRGLGYYVENGFEAECPILGAQKQIAGGGRYEQGVGFAIGIDRLLLAKKKEQEETQ